MMLCTVFCYNLYQLRTLKIKRVVSGQRKLSLKSNNNEWEKKKIVANTEICGKDLSSNLTKKIRGKSKSSLFYYSYEREKRIILCYTFFIIKVQTPIDPRR